MTNATEFWITSDNGKYIAHVRQDILATDPRQDKDLAPELVPAMAEQYDAGDVWQISIYKAKFIPGLRVANGGSYGDGFPVENLLAEPVDTLGEVYGWQYACDCALDMFDELEEVEQ